MSGSAGGFKGEGAAGDSIRVVMKNADNKFYDEPKGYDCEPIALCCGCGVNLIKEKHKEECTIKDKIVKIIKE